MSEIEIKKNDFLLLDWEIKMKTSGNILDKTFNDKPIKGEITEPRLVVVGARDLLPYLDEYMIQHKIPQELVLTVPSLDGYGERDPSKIVTVPTRRITSRGFSARLGSIIDMDGRRGKIITSGAGRVRVDFNHPAAGQELEVKLLLRKKVNDPKERIQLLLHRAIPEIPTEEWKVNIGTDSIEIEIPTVVMFLEGIQLKKNKAALEVKRFMPEYTKIIFHEEV